MLKLARLTYAGLLLACSSVLFAIPTFANTPGGGTNGPNVTLTDNGTTVTMANGTMSIVITKSSAQIGTINYTFNNTGSSRTLNLVSGNPNGGKFYWENSNNEGLSFTYSVVSDPAANGGNYAEVSLVSTTVANVIMDVHYSMLRGSSGFYSTAIWSHTSGEAAFSMGECRDNIYAGSIFNWMSVDAARNRLMEVSGGSAIGVQGAPQEVTLWTNGIYAGRYEDKYCYSADFGDERVWGWSSVGTGYNVGIWNVLGSAEYYNGGSMKRELMSHLGTTILNMLNGGHYGGGHDGMWAAGEVWSKVSGPYFIYCNNISNNITGTNQAAQNLYADAQAQALAEQGMDTNGQPIGVAGAWPYNWFTNANYATAANRGTVTGQIVINDAYNPNAVGSGLWVGVFQQPTTTDGVYDFQQWVKPYQFWVKSDTNGNFSIPNVIAGANYTLSAFGPGAAGTFQSQNLTGGNPPNSVSVPASPFSITVTGGATNNLGTVTWTPTRVGPTVFEIGYPDRKADKFRHGEDYWVGDIGPATNAPSPIWCKFLEYPFDFPNGPNYTVGLSRWTTDWYYVQPCVVNSSGLYLDSSSTINFNLASIGGNAASFYIALASDYQGAVEIGVNGTQIAGANGYSPAYSSSTSQSDTTIRQGIHGCYSDNRISFSTNLLHVGANTITIGLRQTGKVNGNGYFADHAMYDYLRLELSGYVPPAPASVSAYPGNNCNLVSWPVTPGATSYNILRSTTSGSGYASLTNGVTGPVCGSGTNNATYVDPLAANGTTYYYVVQSVNPVGSSANSLQSSGATPSAGLSTSVPAAPTGLNVASVGHQSVTLNWSAVPGANFYSIFRSTLFNTGGGSSNNLGTISLNNTTTGTSYTDTSPTDGSLYSYYVTATSAGGVGGSSASVVGVALPPAPANAPGALTVNLVGTNDSLSWAAVSGAIGYVVQRATSVNGPYIILNSITPLLYTDIGINSNATYYYKVTAVNAGGTSPGAVTTSRPAAPTNLHVIPGNAQIMLDWPASVGATSYILKYGISSGGATNIVASGITSTNFVSTGLTNGVTYYFVVNAVGTAATSGNSPQAAATPTLPPPPNITQLLFNGTNFTLSGSGGVAFSTNYILGSTNLSGVWFPLFTNQFDASGNFSFTNSITPGFPQLYLRLLMN